MSAILQGSSARTGLAFGDLVRPPAVVLLATILIFTLLFWPSFAWMAGEWSGSAGLLSHGYLVAAIAVYLILRSLQQLAGATLAPVWWLLPVVFGMSIVWLMGYVANVAAVQTMVLPAMLLATVTAAFGFAAFRMLAFAILYLYFGVPAWEHLQFVFQRITVVAVQEMINLIDLQAYVEGNFVHIPNGTFKVDGGCSGLSYVVAGLSLAVLYGHLFYDSWKHKMGLVALTLGASMLGNWIRVFVIVNIGYFDGMDNELVADHLSLGWVIFALLMVPVFFVARRLESAHGAVPRQEPPMAGSGPARKGSAITGALLALLMVAAGPVWAKIVMPAEDRVANVSLNLPVRVPGWTGPAQTAWDWQPRFVGVTTERSAEYRRGTTTVLAYTNIYMSQSQGSELIFYRNSIQGSWRRGTADLHKTFDAGAAGVFAQDSAVSPYGSWLIWHRFVIGGEPVIGQMRGKLQQSLASLRGRPEAGVIAFAIPCAASCSDASSELHEFVAALGDRATLEFELEDR